MPILDANDPAFLEQYPNCVEIYDRFGRHIIAPIFCNTETGEVVRLQFTPPWWRWWRRCPWRLPCYPGRSHGFWPAPLRVVPNPAHTHTIIKL
jgi:hypothetical protein